MGLNLGDGNVGGKRKRSQAILEDRMYIITNCWTRWKIESQMNPESHGGKLPSAEMEKIQGWGVWGWEARALFWMN